MTNSRIDEFVGRSTELGQLQDSLRSASDRLFRVVVVEGEAGIGKTALLRQFLRQARGVTTLWASGDESEVELEFGVANQLGSQLPGWQAVRPGVDSLAVGAQLLTGIGLLDRDAAVVVVFDDLHWADLASSRALLFCLRRLHNDCVLAVLATRPQGVPRLGESWARLLSDEHIATSIRLDGLTPSEVTELAAAGGVALTADAGARLQQHTAGSPLYISALLAELPHSALRDNSARLPAPYSFSATVLARIARLSRPTQQLIRAAAVLGTRCTPRSAFATSGLIGIPHAAAVVDEAVESGLLELSTVEAADELVFPHPLLRAAVYGDLGLSERRRLHLAAAAALGPPSALQHRVAAAAGTVDEGLATELIGAADVDLSRGALPTAAGHLVAASRVDADAARAARSLFRAVELLLLSGDVYGAQAHAAAVEALPANGYRRYTLAILAAARADFERAAADVRAVVEAIPPNEDSALYGRCAAVLAYLSAVAGEDETAIAWATRARQVAAGVPTVDTLARQALAWGHAKTGGVEAALALLADIRADSPRPAAFETELLAIRGAVHNWAGNFDASLTDLGAALRWTKLGYPLTDLSYAYTSMAEAQFRSGDWAGAATSIELSISLAEDLDHGWYLPYARCVATFLYAAQEDFDVAATHAHAAQKAADAAASSEARAYASLAGAHLAWASADWVSVSAALQPWDDGEMGKTVDNPNLARWRYHLAEANLAQGRLAEAQRLLAATPPCPWGGTTDADRARLSALMHQQQGDGDEAAAVFERGLAQLTAPSSSLAVALFQLDYGRLLTQRRRRKKAIGPLVAARTVFVRLGAARFLRESDRALAACGAADVVTAVSPQLPGFAALTPREQVVARLVGTGKTNREVAADLYLSVKAIEYHLSNIFTKLGIRSRRQLGDFLPATNRFGSGSGAAH